MRVEDDAAFLWWFLFGRTMQDVSLIVNILPKNTLETSEEDQLLNHRFFRLNFLKTTLQTSVVFVRVTVVDLDLKPVSKLNYYFNQILQATHSKREERM